MSQPDEPRVPTPARSAPRDERAGRQRSAKAGGSMVCASCGVVRHGGRWYWGEPPVGPDHAGTCPACQRIRDHDPAATVRLRGLPAHLRPETEGLIRHVEAREREQHPLERVMALQQDGEALVVTATGTHVAGGIAHALSRRFHGARVRYHDGRTRIEIELPTDGGAAAT